MPGKIVVRGAREHNLKNITVEIPRDRFIVLTGLSGSGKSTLAFDTIYAEGQRRYVESLSSYARQFLGLMDKPDVDVHRRALPRHLHRAEDHIEEPPHHRRNHHRDLRLPAPPLCPDRGPLLPEHNIRIEAQTPERIADRIADGTPGAR